MRLCSHRVRIRSRNSLHGLVESMQPDDALSIRQSCEYVRAKMILRVQAVLVLLLNHLCVFQFFKSSSSAKSVNVESFETAFRGRDPTGVQTRADLFNRIKHKNNLLNSNIAAGDQSF